MRATHGIHLFVVLLVACAGLSDDERPGLIAASAASTTQDAPTTDDLGRLTQAQVVEPLTCGASDEICSSGGQVESSCFVTGQRGRFLREVSQTFVAPISGVLAFVRLNGTLLERDPSNPWASVHVAVREMRDGQVPLQDETTFGEGLVPLAMMPEGTVELGVPLAYGDEPYPLIAGRQYALVVTAVGGLVGIGCHDTDALESGQAAVRQARLVAENRFAASPFVLDKRDLAFSADIVPMPAPSTIVVTPSTLAFGELQKGDSRTLDLTVRNDGDLGLALSQLGVTGDARFSLVGPTFVPTLRGHSSLTLQVRFDATGDVTGPVQAQLRMMTNAPGNPSVIVPLTALMTDPSAGVSPAAIDFGAVSLSQAANPPVDRVNVTNSGYGSFHVTAVRLTDDTAPNFVVTPRTVPFEVTAGGSVPIDIRFVPQGLGERSGTLEIETSDRDMPLLSVPLAGRSGLPANLGPLPSSLAFGHVQGGLIEERTFVLRNLGDDPLTISRLILEVSGIPGFSIEPASVGTLAGGEARTVTVRYAPPVATIGPAAGAVHIETNDPDTPHVAISLSATSTNPEPTISVTSIEFGYLPFDDPPQDRPIVLKNEGYGPLTLHTVTLGDATHPDFSIVSAPTLPAVLNDGQQVTVVVRFNSAPPAGVRNGRVRFVTNDREIPELETTLSGLAGTAPTLEYSPSSLSFGEVQGGKNKALTLTLTNRGQFPLDVSNLRLSSGTSSAFSFTPDSLQPIAPASSRNVTVTFKPTAGDTGQKSGNLLFATNDPQRTSISVPLNGTATNPIPTLSSAPVFPITSITGPSNTGTVTLSNSGTGTLNVQQIRLATGSDPAFSISASPSVPRALTTNTVTITVTFAPSAPLGTKTATLEVVSDDFELPTVQLALSGVAGAPNIQTSPASLAFGEVASGTQKSMNITVSNTGNAPLNVTGFSIVGGASSAYTITSTPVTGLMAAGGTQTLSVRFAPPAGAHGALNDTLRITSSDPDTPTLNVSLTGTRTNPVLQVLDSNLGSTWPAMGNDPAGVPITGTVTLKNNGTGTLTITSITLTSGTSEFSITSKPSTTVELGAGQTQAISVRFLPTAVGARSANLRVVTTERGTIDTLLSGTGRACTATLPNANTTCFRDVATFVSCHAGWWNLDGNTANGCEYQCTKVSEDDLPDDEQKDLNCDGFDGTIAKAVFVHPSGNDANPGTQASPKRSVKAAYAAAAGKHVYVADGTYSESGSLELVAGRNIYGGYTTSWARDLSKRPSISFGSSTAVIADYLWATQTVIERVKIIGANATGTSASAYGVRAFNSSGLRLRHCEIVAGNGTDGLNGTSPGGRGADGFSGSAGARGCENSSFTCASCSQPQGGAGGTNPSCTAARGGRGGNAGYAGGWGAGGEAAFAGTAGGWSVPPFRGNWNPGSEYVGRNGAAGAPGTNGAAGAPLYSTSGYAPAAGGNGGQGGYGHGGGGGGGGGGGDTYCDSFGGGGGGGGAGGCGGQGGSGGTSGGGSFAVYLVSSPVTIESCTLRAGDGGRGGTGGTGQLEGWGASGGWGGDYNRPNAGNPYGGSGEQDDGSNGGRGGRGGDGGRGGHGGGGAGGPSISVVYGTGTPTLLDVTYAQGTAGAGGSSSGNSGTTGLRGSTHTF